MERILLLTNQLQTRPSGGRALLSQLNHDVLSDLLGDRLSIMVLAKAPIRGWRAAIKAIGGHIDGISSGSINSVVDRIRSSGARKVFLDGSNLGTLARSIKWECPEVEVLSFFHNCEARFFLGALKQSPSAHALGVLVANYLAERRAVRFSDKLICLSARDSGLLRKLYGRSATHVSPIALQDKLPTEIGPSESIAREKFALFVGGAFYANRVGIMWFVENVVPRIQIAIRIVGRGFEGLKHELELDPKVEVVGAVDDFDLAMWYRQAQFVIAPIFDGSGMKTKVAEALLFGKRVVGTPEAFVGYDDAAGRMGAVCSTAKEFIDTINRFAAEQLVEFDLGLRALYEEKYSFPAAKARLAKIMDPA
jgi:glycosyltransferase involved in cell wall biosynthesis